MRLRLLGLVLSELVSLARSMARGKSSHNRMVFMHASRPRG